MIWDKRYAEPGLAYGTEPNAFLAEHTGAIWGEDVLCLASGERHNVVFLAERELKVTGVDASMRRGLALRRRGRGRVSAA